MRTRYNRGPSAGARWSGPWVQAAPVAAAPLLSAEQGDDGIIDDSTTERGSADTASANNAAELTTRQGGTNNEPMFTVDGITVDELTWSVPKNAVTGIVGTFAATDDDGDKLEYSVGETTDPDASAHLRAFNEHFALDTESGQITVQLQLGAMFDLGARSSFKVLFQVSDRKNATGASDTVIDDDTLTLTITVTSVDEPPTVPFSVDPRTGTLVKNTDRVGLPSGIDENVLFVFRTGRNSAGYGLSRIGLKMASGSVTSPGPVKITTRGRGHSEGSTVATLEAPALLVASRVNYFTVPAEVDAERRYGVPRELGQRHQRPHDEPRLRKPRQRGRLGARPTLASRGQVRRRSADPPSRDRGVRAVGLSGGRLGEAVIAVVGRCLNSGVAVRCCGSHRSRHRDFKALLWILPLGLGVIADSAAILLRKDRRSIIDLVAGSILVHVPSR